MLTTNVLKYPIFSHVIGLYANNNGEITDVSFMKSLKKLNAHNIFFINVSFMSSLKQLDASSNYGINQNGIQGLELYELNTDDNKKIINV